MNWESYEPLSTEEVVEGDNSRVVPGDMFGSDPSLGLEDTEHIITHINSETDVVCAYNYESEEFEVYPTEDVKGWLENNRPFKPMLSEHSFTLSKNEEPVGVKFVGQAIQTVDTIEQMGPDMYGFGMGVAISEGELGEDITEPYDNDEVVVHMRLDKFIDDTMEDLCSVLVNRTDVGEKFAEMVVESVLATLEVNARKRLRIDADPILAESEDDMEYIDPDADESYVLFDETDKITFHG